MQLLPPIEAKQELPAARKRLKEAKREILRLCQTFRAVGGNAFNFAADMAEANEELRGAYEWFGECYYQAKRMNLAEIEDALAKSASERHNGLDIELATMDSEDRIEWAIDITHNLSENREAVEALLAQYAERWFDNG